MYTPKAACSLSGKTCSTKTRLRKLHEGARPMRQALAARWQAVFFVARHFAKSACVAVGQEHRIVAESLSPARRPDQGAVDPGLEILDMAVGPGPAQRRD